MKTEKSKINIQDKLIFMTAAWSGFFVMGIEMLGGRLLSPYFGSSIFVWGGIITVFMSCLSLGYLIGGRISSHNPTLRKFGILILIEAIFALPIVFMGDKVLETLSYFIDDARYGSLLGSLLMFGPTIVMSGMISPYAIRLLVKNMNESGRSAGSLYFISTFGSASGTILTSFYFVMYFEVNSIILTFVAISSCVGISLISWPGIDKTKQVAEVNQHA